MKKLSLVILGMLLLALNVLAQSPELFHYQAILRDSEGQVYVNKKVEVKIEILVDNVFGEVAFTEIHKVMTSPKGYVNIQVGSIAGGFNKIDWSSHTYFIKVSVDKTIVGTNQIISVPYALHAKTAEEYTESDPFFISSPAGSINFGNITDWSTAFTWGNHSTAGYLTDYTETDPAFTSSPANSITLDNISNWNTSFEWSDHSIVGYLTDYTETDPVYTSSPANNISIADIDSWNSAFNWGDHSLMGYLTTYSGGDSLFATNFNIINPQQDQLLKYNNSNEKWENWTVNYLTSEIDGSVTNEIQTLSISGNNLSINGTGGNTVTLPASGNIQAVTRTQLDALTPEVGELAYNTTDEVILMWNGTNWIQLSDNCFPQPTIANAGDDPIFYDETTSVILEANTPIEGIGTWSIISGTGGAFADIHDPNTTFTGDLCVNYTLQWEIMTDCSSSTDDVNVTFSPNIVADAGPDVRLFYHGQFVIITGNLAANDPLSGTGIWTGDTESISDINDPHSEIIIAPLDYLVLTWNIVTVCGVESSDTLIIDYH